MNPQTPRQFGCIHCGQNNFITQNALRQHLKQGFCAKVEEHLKAGWNQDLSPMSWVNEDRNSEEASMDDGVGIWTYSYYFFISIALIRFWTELTGGQTTPKVLRGS